MFGRGFWLRLDRETEFVMWDKKQRKGIKVRSVQVSRSVWPGRWAGAQSRVRKGPTANLTSALGRSVALHCGQWMGGVRQGGREKCRDLAPSPGNE